ncbi:MAG: Flavin-dependent L-tryptophan oxidase RebO precursor [Actinomycetota bacterium]|jgi:monoamine oxidase
MHLAPVAWHVTHWGSDPWSRGSWTSLGVGGSTADRATVGTPVDGRFVLAGDATNPVAPSMTHGAYDEGVRAARWAVDGGARRIAVIGAGFAGLGAARTATDLGADVVVLEARDRIGGRAHTVDLGSGVHADAGAAWLQQGPTNSLARLAEQWGLRTVPTDFHHPLAAASDGPVGDVPAAHAALAAHLATTPADATVADVLPAYLAGLPPHERRAAQFAVDLELELENPAPAHLLGARTALDEPGVGVGDRWLPDGYAAIQRRLADGIDIRLGTPVCGIDWHADGVDIRTADGDVLRVDRCICTIPVWLVPELDLEPGLPDGHLAALRRLVPGVVEKVVLRFDERWWPVSPSGYLRWYDHPASWGEWLDLTDGVGAPVVAGLIAGTAVARHHRGDDERIALAATAALARWAASIT